MEAIYPGTFDPPTKAHRDIYFQAQEIFTRVTVVIAQNATKGKGLMTMEQRLLAWRDLGVKNVEIAMPQESIVDVARRVRATCIVRGIRGPGDVEPEQAYRNFIEYAGARGIGVTVTYFMPPSHLQHVSSTAARSCMVLSNWRELLPLYLDTPVIKRIEAAFA